MVQETHRCICGSWLNVVHINIRRSQWDDMSGIKLYMLKSVGKQKGTDNQRREKQILYART